MRRFYRNRHATFMKALLEKKKSAEEEREAERAKEEKQK